MKRTSLPSRRRGCRHGLRAISEIVGLDARRCAVGRALRTTRRPVRCGVRRDLAHVKAFKACLKECFKSDFLYLFI